MQDFTLWEGRQGLHLPALKTPPMPRPWLQELRLVRETSEMALGDYERRRENELQEVRLRHG